VTWYHWSQRDLGVFHCDMLYTFFSHMLTKLSLLVFTHATLPSAGISCRCVSLCLTVTCRCCTEMVKCRITQTMPHDGPGILVFCCRKSQLNPNGVILITNVGVKCRWGRLNAGAVTANWRLSTRSIVNLVQSQVYHMEHPPCLFAAHLPRCSTSRRFVSDSWSFFI